MTTENQQMLERLGELTDAVHGKLGAIDSRLNAVASTWDKLRVTWFVDQATGNDQNDGTKEAPLASIQEAINRTPPYGNPYITVRGQYQTTERYISWGRDVALLAGYGADFTTNASLRTNLIVTADESAGRIALNSFGSMYRSDWTFYGFSIQVPSATALTAAHPGLSYNQTLACFLSRSSSTHGPAGGLHFTYCDIDLTNDPFGFLFSNTQGVHLVTSGVSYTNPIAGVVHPSIPSGALPKDYGHVITTNLTSL